MQDRKLRIAFAFYPYGGNGGFSSEHPSLRRWFAKTAKFIDADPRFEPYPTGNKVWAKDFSDTPIPMTRNLSVMEAKRAGTDVLVMVDSDQVPDLYVGADPEAKPFFQSSFEFLYQHWDKGPCLIFAPYCGPPPHPITGGEENVYVFHWDLNRNHWEKGLKSLKQFTRHEAALCKGFMEVAAGPTGLIMIDMRVFEHPDLVLPWFEYEWDADGPRCQHCNQPKPGFRIQKATTEDVFFTRNCFYAGIPVYCNWDAWAGHVKPEIVGKPWAPRIEQYHEHFLEQARQAVARDEAMVELNVGKGAAQIAEELGLTFVSSTEEISEESEPRPSKIPEDCIARDEIPGWFDFADIYREQVERVNGEDAFFVEIGSFLGKSTCFMAQAIECSGKKIRFAAIDPWKSETVYPQLPTTHPAQMTPGRDLYPEFEANLKQHGVREYVEAYRTTSEKVLPHFADSSLDFVMVDGDHRRKSCLADLRGYWFKLKPGGVMAAHDAHYYEVQGAIDEFSREIGLLPVLRGDTYVFTKPLAEA